MEGRNCASCHHAPMLIWSLNHAKQRGFEVDEKTLAEVTAWTLDPKVRLMPKPAVKQVHEMPKAPAAKSEAEEKQGKAPIDQGAPVAQEAPGASDAPDADKEPWVKLVDPVVAYYTLATDRVQPPPVPAEIRARMIQHFLDKQGADGSWPTYVQQPPMLDGAETSTLYMLVALRGSDGRSPPSVPDWTDRQARALDFLAKTKPTDEVQRKLWRLFLRKELDASGAARLGGSQEAETAAVLSQQHTDGGWGQTPSLPSDAYATGQVLYFLDAAGCTMSADARDKAVAFLVKTQKPDGSWPMTSRPRTAPKNLPGSKDLEIIGYAATAWAAMGLVSAATP